MSGARIQQITDERPAEIVGCERRDSRFLRALPEHQEDRLITHAPVDERTPATGGGPEQRTGLQSSHRQPRIERGLRAISRVRDPVFASLALTHAQFSGLRIVVGDIQRHDLAAPEAAAVQDRQERRILPSEARALTTTRRVPESATRWPGLGRLLSCFNTCSSVVMKRPTKTFSHDRPSQAREQFISAPSLLVSHWHDLQFLFAGKTIVGGLIGGLMAVESTKWWLGVTTRTGDLFAIPLAAGIAVGRVGCFLTGLEDRTHGTATLLWTGVDFGDGVRRHPTQLYEIAWLLLLIGVLANIRTRLAPGDEFSVFMVGYMTCRLLVDTLKPDPTLALGMSSIQWAAVATLAYYAPDLRRWVRGGT